MGFGDEIMTTAAARELKQKHPHAHIIVGDGKREFWSVIFENNPHISRFANTSPQDQIIWLKDYPGNRPYHLKTTLKRVFYNMNFRARPGNIYFSEAELLYARQQTRDLPPFIVIEPHIKGLASARNKDWGWDKWQQLVNRVGSQYLIVQMGPPGTKALIGTRFVETNSFRCACAVLAQAKACVLPEGGLHHAAAALNIPGVVIFGGYTHPQTTGYAIHTNLFIEKGSPCGKNTPCRHCRQCMDAIKVEQVAIALQKQLATHNPDASRTNTI